MHYFFVAPTAVGTGLSSVCMGLTYALDELGVRVAHFKPILQGSRDSAFAARGVTLAEAQRLVSSNRLDQLLEMVLHNLQGFSSEADAVIVEGLVPAQDEASIELLNRELARVLGADIILVAAKAELSSAQLNERIVRTCGLFGGRANPNLIGCIINKAGAPAVPYRQLESAESNVAIPSPDATGLPVFADAKFRCLGVVPWSQALIAPRTSDVAAHLRASWINRGDAEHSRVHSISFVARTVPNMVHSLRAGALIVTPGDREDVLIASCLAVLNGTPLAGVLLTGGIPPDGRVLTLCKGALASGLPLLATTTDTLATAQALSDMNPEVPAEDRGRLTLVQAEIARNIDAQWLAAQARIPQEMRLSPPAFRYALLKRAQRQLMRIVLPEGEEPRTLQAAVACTEQRIARCVLLGAREVIAARAESLGLTLPPELEIIEPEQARMRYVEPMVRLRAHKGLTRDMAAAQLEDNVVMATLMLAEAEVDGLVSGAIHTTANTIRPALQLIKTKPGVTLVSSVFFMLLPDEALVYGDCAVNPDPSAEELADIAIQSGETASAFGIEPRIAMISYSTGSSGAGSEVEKVRRATEIARAKRPDLLIDGPLQYDAAAIASVAAAKAPDSKVAGRATVFIFPDLNTGNTTYKAVQRSAQVLSVGPVLQGLKKPVNDLSRGALVDDIIYTIAITAIQAQTSTEHVQH